jgi:peptide chain release factor subunit 1
MEEREKLKLRKLLKELKEIKGRHTELVSVYIPAGFNLVEIINQLTEEKSTAMNIKSKTTRKNVLDALEKIISHLKLFKQTPPNGLVVFCGNVAKVEGESDVKLWSIEPPEKLNTKLYWCDQVFVLEPLEEMVREKEVYGLIVLDAREANIGLLKGKAIESLKHLESTVPSKSVKGGMSQKRYDRIREDAINEFLTKVGEIASKLFLEQKDLKGVIIGGPGYIKELLLKEDYLHYQIKNKILGIKDTSYTGEYGLEELVNRSEDLLREASVAKEKALLNKFFIEVQKEGKVYYKLEEIENALNIGAIDTLLISDEFDLVKAKLECDCGNAVEILVERNLLAKQTCKKCGKEMKIKEVKEMLDEFINTAKRFGTKVEFISTNTREGVQFKQLSGIGAFLRYKLT